MLQKKRKNIRDRYARELKENKGKSGQGRKVKSSYMYANQLGFLSDVIQRRPTDTSMDDGAPLSPNSQSESASESPATIHDDSPTVHVAKKRKGNTLEQKLVEALDNHSIRQKQKAQTVNSEEDDDRLFLLSLVPFMKSIPPHFKFAARMDIMQSINKYNPIQSPAPSVYSPQLPYNQIPTQAPSHQSGILHQWQYLNPHAGPSGLPDFNQSPSQQEPQTGPSGIQRQSTESPLMSPGSSYSQDTDITQLF